MLPPKKRMRMIPPESSSPPPVAAAVNSDLPEPLIHHIISYLPPKSSGQLCIISKRFLSAWNSTPYLSFEYSQRGSGEENMTRFLDYIQSTIDRRPRGINLEKFRIKSMVTLFHDYRIYSAINYAIDCGVQTIDLEFCNQPLYFHLSPLRILSAAASLKSLRLRGFDLDPQPRSLRGVLAISHPLLEDLKLSSCMGFQAIKIISCGKLKSLEFGFCQMLGSLDIDSQTSNLESLTFRGSTMGSRSMEIGEYTVKFSPTCPYMKRIFLSEVVVDGVWVNELLSKLPNLESFGLIKCHLKGDMISVLHDNLKDVDLDILSRNSVSAAVRGQKLESTSLSYRSLGYGLYRISNLAGFESLQSLKLNNASTTDEWLVRNVSSLANLKKLELCRCPCLKKISISNNNLESLRITACILLEKVEVSAVNLSRFLLFNVGKIPEELVLDSSGKLLALISIQISNSFYFEWSRQVLNAIGQSKELCLSIMSLKNLTIPKSLREKRIDPWYNLQKIEVYLDEDMDRATSGEIVDLVYSLLWLAPRLQAISMFENRAWSEERDFTKTVEDLKKTIKLKYYEEGDHDEEELTLISTCCEPWWPIKCWRHSLREVTMENFNAQEKKDLVQFFMHNSRTYLDNMLHCKMEI